MHSNTEIRLAGRLELADEPRRIGGVRSLGNSDVIVSILAARRSRGDDCEMDRQRAKRMDGAPRGRFLRMYRPVIRLAIGAMIVALAGNTLARAQASQSNSSLSPANGQSQTPPPRATNKRQPPSAKMLEKGSIFFPDIAHSGQPLTAGAKFKLAITKSVSPAAFLGAAAGAGLGQAADSPAGWGQGASGYGKRYGASMAKSASNNLIGDFFLCSVLHDDPRYFVMGDGSLKESVKYALRRLVIIRKDDGGEAFNWPGTMGPLASAGLANAYLPEGQRTVGYTFENYGWSLASSVGINLLKEYWPTITRKVLVPMGISHDSDTP